MRNRSASFTLIELLVSISLISIVCITLFYFLYSSVGLMNRTLEVERSAQVVRSVAGRMSGDIVQSGGISPGSGSKRLVIGDISYEYVEGKIRRTQGADTYFMTTDGEIRSLEFYYPTNKQVKIAITPRAGGQYYLSVYARN